MKERGQTMVLVAIFLMGAVAVGTLLIVNALSWFNARRATYQAVSRAANDGAGELVWIDGLPLLGVADPEQPDLPAAGGRHCLDPDRARSVTLNSLRENLGRIAAPYVTDSGAPLSPAQVVSDTTYLLELSVVNPPALNCPAGDPEPTYPPGESYSYQRPYVHLAVRLPLRAMFGPYQVTPVYVIDVTSATDPAGGN
ncbi:MAG: hypothetical protein FOGNACKC_05473 [Anaerolineae bacterium]|nr:hypothetical protein [Anaerolineae bacterium]